MTQQAILPEGWAIAPLGRLVRFGNGQDYKDVEVSEGGYPVYGSGGEFRRAGKYLHDGESVLFGRKGTVDRPLFVSGKFWTVDTMYFTVPEPSVHPKFLYYSATTIPFDLYSTNTALPSMTSGTLKAHRLPLPPLDEQRAIAEYLDRETSQIDALVAKQGELIGLLRERRLRQVTEVFSRLGEPNSELRRVARVQTGVTLSGSGDPRHSMWPYLRVANVQMGRVDLGEVKKIRLSRGDAEASMLRAGDVLMTEGGDIDKLGRGAIWDGSIDPIVHQNHVFAVRVQPDRLVPNYLAWWLDTMTSRRYFYLTAKKTTNLASTNKTVVGRLPINVPRVDEQLEIVRRIEEQTSRIDTLIAKAEEHIALAKERRSALITAAVTGQIDVRTAQKAS